MLSLDLVVTATDPPLDAGKFRTAVFSTSSIGTIMFTSTPFNIPKFYRIRTSSSRNYGGKIVPRSRFRTNIKYFFHHQILQWQPCF